MPRLNPVSAQQLARIVKKLGFQFMRQKGSHATFHHPDGRMIVIPMHAKSKIDGGLLLKMVKNQLMLGREAFEKLL